MYLKCEVTNKVCETAVSEHFYIKSMTASLEKHVHLGVTT